MNTLTYVIIAVVLTVALMLVIFRVMNAERKKKSRKLAHDLRSRLAVMKTNIEIAMLDNRVTDELTETLKSNVEEINRTSGMLDVLSK